MMSNSKKNPNGHIAGISLPSFMQMIEMEQKSCTLKVFTKNNIGYIFFQNGTLLDSKTGSLENLDALYQILSWDDVVIDVDKNTSKKQNFINLPLMHVLIESTRQTDEIAKHQNHSISDSEESKKNTEKRVPSRILYDENFCLEIGIKLLIDFDNIAVPFQSRLVGMEHGKYLVIKAPGPIGRIDHDLFKVEELIIKTLYKGTIYAFHSKLMNIISKPSRLMFIDYPEKIEHHELRSHKRFKCSIVTQAEVEASERSGVIENISKGGCLCVMEPYLTDKNHTFDLLNNNVSFRCHFPGSKSEVRFVGEIKNVKQKSDEIVLGIEFSFKEATDKVKGIINNYIQLIGYSSEPV